MHKDKFCLQEAAATQANVSVGKFSHSLAPPLPEAAAPQKQYTPAHHRKAEQVRATGAHTAAPAAVPAAPAAGAAAPVIAAAADAAAALSLPEHPNAQREASASVVSAATHSTATATTSAPCNSTHSLNQQSSLANPLYDATKVATDPTAPSEDPSGHSNWTHNHMNTSKSNKEEEQEAVIAARIAATQLQAVEHPTSIHSNSDNDDHSAATATEETQPIVRLISTVEPAAPDLAATDTDATLPGGQTATEAASAAAAVETDATKATQSVTTASAVAAAGSAASKAAGRRKGVESEAGAAGKAAAEDASALCAFAAVSTRDSVSNYASEGTPLVAPAAGAPAHVRNSCLRLFHHCFPSHAAATLWYSAHLFFRPASCSF